VPAIFPRWTNKLPLLIALTLPVVVAAAVGVVWYWFSPKYTDVGYRPNQPVSFSHKLHAGELGLDCRFCHNTVESADVAAIPPTSTCMNCHVQVKKDSPRLALVRQSFETGESIPWVRVHQLPDYAFFSHQPHLAAGVGCASCHGRVDSMTVVNMDQPLSMSWCLDCHRDPKPHLRPKGVSVTDMTWTPSSETKEGEGRRSRDPEPPTHCSGCHR
jgi:hypothetical protein